VKRVLVVDDSDTVRSQVRKALTPAGYEIIEAIDGLEGLKALRANLGLSLVLCDVNMPNLNGLDMLTIAVAEGFAVPIIILTSEGLPSLIRRARESGAKSWILKPFRDHLLLAAVNKLSLGDMD
jgi:two-component system chemotaxis response regulator CheY